MRSSVKDTFVQVQVRFMFLAFLFVTLLSVGVMFLESWYLADANELLGQLIIILSIFLGLMYSQLAMLIFEIVFEDELYQVPLVSFLARLAPDMTLVQRFEFLSLILKRQITSLISLMTIWIIVGGTHRSTAIVFTMMMITALTLYGTHYIEKLYEITQNNAISTDPTQDNLTG